MGQRYLLLLIALVTFLETFAISVSTIYRSVVLGGTNTSNLLLKLVFSKARNGDKKFPVVLLSSGADCPSETYSWLASKLAQRCNCCVVLSDFVQPFGPSTVLLSHPFDMTKLNNLDSYKEGPSTEGIEAILNEIRSLSNGSGGNEELHGRVDMSKIILGGHSNGARTVLDLLSFGSRRLFDQKDTKVAGAFTYGASLVHSNGFVEKGSIIPCDPSAFGESQAPPLLMMAGSNDLILSSGSSTGDSTETVRRTIDEAFKRGGYKGNVDLLVLKGANHMLPTFPVPPCSGTDRDGTLGKDFTAESYREVLGGIICDFVSGCLTDCESTTTNSTKLRIPSRMFHSIKSYQHSDDTAKKIAIVHMDHILEEEAWKLLSSKFDGWVDTIKSELALEPSTKFDGGNTLEWDSGSSIFGSIEGWSSSKAIWAARYSARHSSSSQRSLGFNVWLSHKHSKMTEVPHLTLHCSVRAGKATIMADHLPRVDLAENPEYVETYYGGRSERLWKKIKQACGDPLLSTFTSADVKIRSVCGPNAVALSVDLEETSNMVEVLVDVLDDYVEIWLEFLRKATEVESPDVSERDGVVRRVLWDHERRAGESIMNPELAKSLADALAGFL